MKIKKRGIQIPVRIIINALIILFEIALLVVSAVKFSEKFLGIYWLFQLISIITVIYIINMRGNQSYKIMWIIFILLVPPVGTIFYLLWGGGRMFPHLKKHMKKCTEKYFSLLPEDSKAVNSLNYNDMLHSRQAEFLRKEAGLPVYCETTSKFYAPCEKLFPFLLEELREAEKYIYIEFFILGDGYMWNQIFKILKEKAAAGVEIKVIFDDFGSIKYQYKSFIPRLKKYGIQVSAFNRISPSLDGFMNNRNHRKIIIIDGKTAVTGGFNISDEYINRIKKHGYWMDSGIIIKGKAVNTFLAMFCSMWEFNTKQEIDFEKHLADSSDKNDGFYIPYCDDPLNDANPAEGIYMQILNNAQRYVYIATPYLILDNTMISAICLAAKSGVDVKIITPSVPDKWYVHPVTQFYYSELMDAGVEIYEYTPGFIHSKMFLSDDNVATVGTVNMDYRSFYFHFECGVWMSGNESVADIKSNFESIIADSEKIENEKWKKRPLSQKIKQALLHLFAPFM